MTRDTIRFMGKNDLRYDSHFKNNGHNTKQYQYLYNQNRLEI